MHMRGSTLHQSRYLQYILLPAMLVLGIFRGHASAAVSCTQAGIQGIAPSDTTITSATLQSTPVIYCDIFGYVTTTNPGPNQVIFELGLPDPTAWNGGFVFTGNGGYAGGLDTAELPVSAWVPFGPAAAVTDTGHESSSTTGGPDASFALNNPGAQADWLYRSVHVVTVASKAIIDGYFGQEPGSLFYGCSTGGRQALVEAQRYPDDFNAIVAISPALGNWVAGFNHNSEAVTATRASYLPSDKIDLINQAVLQGCDAADGVSDGLIQDPRKCTFDPASLRCKGPDKPSCLTSAQVATVDAIYQGTGQTYPGYTKSDPGVEDNWEDWITGLTAPDQLRTSEPWSSIDDAPLQFLYQDQFLKYFVFSDPNYNSLTFNINDPRQLARLETVTRLGDPNSDNPDLSTFANNGGKLLIFQGWSDAAVSPLETVQYYRNLTRNMGGLAATQNSVRLFMLPGVEHCGGGSGPDSWDAITPAVNWLQTGTAPDQIIATSYENDDPTTGIVTRTMPLCVYPAQAKYTGGDVNQASSWTCPSD
jgi:pimeloyl-ACP methyl ester carboxylesterase